ncbi:uncharacterized protein LOC129751875 [Uranotaenia lowii]|uniref:uncharacterized protein LOC129751875 n=1 Tax=Uranotaenia lowii TaxID=190385 RepID=UPI002479B450|nr:uncharacterized protein LOC129751875 [Uranotaenia lowii]
MYYSTPHSTTGKTPSELLYGRNIRTKLPCLDDIGSTPQYTDYRDKDQQMKLKGKENEDSRRHAVPSQIKIGDQVLMKNMLSGNKLSSTFNPERMIVTGKQGSRLTVQNAKTGKMYDRNTCHVKKTFPADFPTENQLNPNNDLAEATQPVPDIADDVAHQDSAELSDGHRSGHLSGNQTEVAYESLNSRPRRVIKAPARFAGYDMSD